MTTSTKSTKWLLGDNTFAIYETVGYLLWETSTMFMAANGVETDEEVNMWIEVLKTRLHENDKYITLAIESCQDYLKPVKVLT